MPEITKITLNGEEIEFDAEGRTLLSVLRDEYRHPSVKDGCSPQGQCGACTVLVDGQPRVSCVTPARRVAGRAITTVAGLDTDVAQRWVDAFCATGASQCGFCTPGIVMRLEGLRHKVGNDDLDGDKVRRALAAHLCRCTGWQTIVEAAVDPPARAYDREIAARRATLEGGAMQFFGSEQVLGVRNFAADSAPADALIALRAPTGDWVVGENLDETRGRAGKVQGRRTTVAVGQPLEVPDGEWARTLRTSWVDPGYVETDASWCAPGGVAVSPLANGGAFGGKVASEIGAVARRLADESGRPVCALWSREDVARLAPKRPPVAAGIRGDGSGVIRVVSTEGIEDAIGSVAPSLRVEQVDAPGPPTSSALRAAGAAEAAVLLVAARGDQASGVALPGSGWAEARFDGERIEVSVDAGAPLDAVVLRSYCIGAAHMAYSWVTSESLAVDESGEVLDLTVRSLGIVSAAAMPPVEVDIVASDREPVNGSDSVFAAVAAAVWAARGYPPEWPTG